MPLDGVLPEEVDVLIVGSGFGGSVMAAELAREYPVEPGEPPRICLVERGQAYPPGSFPRDPAGVSRNFWDPNAGLYGMFHVASFSKMDVVVSSGLGGGSLIYANVMMRKDPTWFTQRIPERTSTGDERWMLTADDLEPHYREVLEFLDVQELPHGPNVPSVFNLVKTSRFLQNTVKALVPNTGPAARRWMSVDNAVDELGDVAGYAPLAVRFLDGSRAPAVGAPLPPAEYGNIHDNSHGPVHRTTCTLIGECDVGCNQGAKNSLDHTYLSEASDNGCSIHTLTEVIGLQRDKDRSHPFTVTVQRHRRPRGDYGVRTVGEPPREYPAACTAEHPDTTEIRARRVVLAAGTLGTTSLLLRHAGPLGINSDALGTRFCGNGDFLAFAYNVEGRLDATRGPVITAYRRYPADTDPDDPVDAPDPGGDGKGSERQGMYIEDAGYPAFAAWLVQLLQAGTSGTNALNTWLRRRFNPDATPPGDDHSNMSAELHDILADGAFSGKMMPLLGMGRDEPIGRFRLDNDQMVCDWTATESETFYTTMIERMRIIARGFGGALCANPLYTFLKRGITVHPVGGCPMDTTILEGVVDSYGRVRKVPGLRVCDGSVFPGPIGPNPSLTIAAFAHRCAQHLLCEDWNAPPPPIDKRDPKKWEKKNPDSSRGLGLPEDVDPEQ